MGLLDELRRLSTTEIGCRFIGPLGKSYADMPIGDGTRPSPTNEHEILRGDLAKMLYESTLDLGIKYRFNTKIASVANILDKPAQVELSDGSMLEADVVVAADGQWSSLRKMVFGADAVKTVDKNMIAAYFTIPRIDSDTKWWDIYPAGDGRTLMIRPDPHGTHRAMLSYMPSISLLLYFCKQAADATLCDHRAGREGGMGPDGTCWSRSAARLAQKDVRWRWMVRRAYTQGHARRAGLLLPKGRADQDGPLVERPCRAPWRRRLCPSVSLLSTNLVEIDLTEPATPLTGAGTMLAVNGAYVLAGELSKVFGSGESTDPTHAFGEYERVFKPFVEQQQSLPSFVPGIMHPGSTFKVYCMLYSAWLLSLIVKLPLIRSAGDRSHKLDFKVPFYDSLPPPRPPTNRAVDSRR